MNIVNSSIYTPKRSSNGTFNYELILISSFNRRMSLETGNTFTLISTPGFPAIMCSIDNLTHAKIILHYNENSIDIYFEVEPSFFLNKIVIPPDSGGKRRTKRRK